MRQRPRRGHWEPNWEPTALAAGAPATEVEIAEPVPATRGRLKMSRPFPRALLAYRGRYIACYASSCSAAAAAAAVAAAGRSARRGAPDTGAGVVTDRAG